MIECSFCARQRAIDFPLSRSHNSHSSGLSLGRGSSLVSMGKTHWQGHKDQVSYFFERNRGKFQDGFPVGAERRLYVSKKRSNAKAVNMAGVETKWERPFIYNNQSRARIHITPTALATRSDNIEWGPTSSRKSSNVTRSLPFAIWAKGRSGG